MNEYFRHCQDRSNDVALCMARYHFTKLIYSDFLEGKGNGYPTDSEEYAAYDTERKSLKAEVESRADKDIVEPRLYLVRK